MSLSPDKAAEARQNSGFGPLAGTLESRSGRGEREAAPQAAQAPSPGLPKPPAGRRSAPRVPRGGLKDPGRSTIHGRHSSRGPFLEAAGRWALPRAPRERRRRGRGRGGCAGPAGFRSHPCGAELRFLICSSERAWGERAPELIKQEERCAPGLSPPPRDVAARVEE